MNNKIEMGRGPIGVAGMMAGMVRRFWIGAALISLVASGVQGEVAVVFNVNFPESESVARYYASKRSIPEDRVLGLSMPTEEEIGRDEFDNQIQAPLLKELESRKIFIYREQIVPAEAGKPGVVVKRLVGSQIRYLVLCHGVPLKIREDSSLKEEIEIKLPSVFTKNQAAVDSELALLPAATIGYRRAAFITSPVFRAEKPADIGAHKGILMVSRLDGPTPEVAKGLVDKALEAEKSGMWGRAYVDARGITDPQYKIGDDWMRAGAQTLKLMGWEVTLDEASGVFPPEYPMSHIGVYMGWYAHHVTGPLAFSNVDWMPGAFGYHLHSFSADTVRDGKKNWVGPMLAHGVTVTMGCVYEPYLQFTPDLGLFCDRFFRLGMTFGEAAYASMNVLSWQTTMVGDPLYRPNQVHMKTMHQRLLDSGASQLEWSHLRIINLNLVQGVEPLEMIRYLDGMKLTESSAVLLEKKAYLYYLVKDVASLEEATNQALAVCDHPSQKVRMIWNEGVWAEELGGWLEAYRAYGKLDRDYAMFEKQAWLKEKLIQLARQLKMPAEESRYQRQLEQIRAASSR